jgi:predicted esterase
MDVDQVRSLRGIEYGLGQSLDIYEPVRPRGSVALLLWHGRGPNERDVMESLAQSIAGAGVSTFVPDWTSDDGRRGRHHLSSSLAFAGDLVDALGLNRLVLAGWSLGASAGLDVVRMCTVLGGWRPDGFIGLAGGYDGSPYRTPYSGLAVAHPSVPVLLIHGSSDEVVPPSRSRRVFDDLRPAGWDIELREVKTDHAGTIGTVYDPVRRRCVRTDNRDRLATLATVAGWVAAFALRDSRMAP